MIIINNDKVSFELNENDFTAKIVNSPESKGDILIPFSINNNVHDYIITSIDKCAFENNENIKSVSFFIGSKIHLISDYAFYTSSIEAITIPDSVTKIGSFSFAWCNSLREVIFSNQSNLQSISKQAFFLSNLNKLNLPLSVEKLESGWCNGFALNNFTISPRNPHFYYTNSKLLIGKSDQKSNVFDVLYFASRDVQKAIIPSYITQIAPYAFSSCHNLNSIIFLPDSKLDFIGEWAFYSTSIENISIPSCVTKIECNAFSECICLKTIEFSKKSELNSVGSRLFYNSSLKRVLIPSKIKQMGRSFFYQCDKLESIEFLSDELIFIERTFVACKKLSIVLFSNAKKVTFGMDVFQQVPSDCLFFFRTGAEVKIEILL